MIQAINILGAMPVDSTTYRDITNEICQGCILTTFMLTTLGVGTKVKDVKEDVRQLMQRGRQVFLPRGLSALIVGNAAIAVVLKLSTLKWTTT